MTKQINSSDSRQLPKFTYPEGTLLFWDTLFLALSPQVLLTFPRAARIIGGEGSETRFWPLIFGLECSRGTDHFKTWRQL